jgi:hypothetical protein
MQSPLETVKLNLEYDAATGQRCSGYRTVGVVAAVLGGTVEIVVVVKQQVGRVRPTITANGSTCASTNRITTGKSN